MKPDRINSLTGLRVLVMLTIFASHLSYLMGTPFQRVYAWIDNGRLGVNFFLVLSGFVLALGYGNRLNANSISQDIQFVKKRISKIYIPYLITMILAIPLYISQVKQGGGTLSTGIMISRLIINTGMVQSVIPLAKYSASINGVSWFISTVFIIYIFTPAILRLNHKAAEHKTLQKQILFAFAVLAAHCVVYMVIRQIEYIRFADRGLSIIYINPLIRIFPFLLGIVACNIYHHMDSFRIKNGSIVEALSIAVSFLWWIAADRTGLPTVVTECMDMVISMLVILVFSLSTRGIISGLLGSKKMLALGKVSLEFYLVHYLVINYGIMAAKRIGMDQGIAVLPVTILFLAVSLGGAFLLHSFAARMMAALGKKQK